MLLPAQDGLKIAVRNIVVYEEKPLNWNEPLSPGSRKIFVTALKRLVTIEGIMWSRPLVPALGYKITKNSPAIVYSGDASGDNMTATAHLVTELRDDDPNNCLLYTSPSPRDS